MGERGLAQAGQVFQQQMTACQQRDNGQFDLLGLAHDQGIDLFQRSGQGKLLLFSYDVVEGTHFGHGELA